MSEGRLRDLAVIMLRNTSSSWLKSLLKSVQTVRELTGEARLAELAIYTLYTLLNEKKKALFNQSMAASQSVKLLRY